MTKECVLQDWTLNLPMMQQTVLLTATRGPDGITKYHPLKYLLRWYRRCFLKSSLDRMAFTDPFDPRGGSFTGPSVKYIPGGQNDAVALDNAWRAMGELCDKYIASIDEIPHHFAMHFMHGVEILGYKHPDPKTSAWWNTLYLRLVEDMHLWPESLDELDRRLGDTYDGWMERNDKATMT